MTNWFYPYESTLFTEVAMSCMFELHTIDVVKHGSVTDNVKVGAEALMLL